MMAMSSTGYCYVTPRKTEARRSDDIDQQKAAAVEEILRKLATGKNSLQVGGKK